jgi:cyclopropane-fatty-acyl-phospholipid synthase
MFFTRLLDRLIVEGDLTYVDHKGKVMHFGSGQIEGIAPVTVRLTDGSADRRLGLRPLLSVGEAYMDGQLVIEQGTLYDFLATAAHNIQAGRHDARLLRFLQRADHLWRGIQQYNPLPAARRNASHHYDISLAIYDLFLDPDRQYSCAYFERDDMTLEEAQLAKKRHIMAKLALAPGQSVLDIGCGWGGLALTLAREAKVDVTGITLSEQQWLEAQKRAADQHADTVRFQLVDYREVRGKFDRVVSVGMFEHVGIAHFDQFFHTVRDRLSDDGVALLHFICRSDGPGTTNPWIRRYIFPGGYSPALSEVLPAIERSGLYVTDIEILRLHYAMTLREWRRRFLANRAKAAQRYDERFCRMWEFYLTGSEVAFRFQGHVVVQIQLSKQLAGLPLTRDYMIGDAMPLYRRQAE